MMQKNRQNNNLGGDVLVKHALRDEAEVEFGTASAHEAPDRSGAPVECQAVFSRRFLLGGIAAASVTSAAMLLNPLNTSSAFAEPTSAEKQAEVDEFKKNLEAWSAELDKASDDYFTAMGAHDSAVESMEEAKGQIGTAEQEITRLQARLQSRAKEMYKDGPLSFLDVIFGTSSFSEFTTTWGLVESINDEDATLIASSKQAKETAQTAHEEYLAQEKIAQEKLEEAIEIKTKAEETVAATEAAIASLEAEVAALIEQERIEEERRQQEAAAAAARNNNSGASQRRGNGKSNYPPGTFSSAVEAAISQLGVPYVWGGTKAGVGLDCSGLTQWCYAQVGVSIPRVSEAQKSAANSLVPVSEAQPGDILWRQGHVAIYAGEGAYIHAPQTGDVVRYAYNPGSFTCACRY